MMTTALKPYPDSKDSGVPWLGPIPEHWQSAALKRISAFNPPKSEANDLRDSDEAVTFLPMERVGTDGAVDARELRPAKEAWNGYTYFRRKDVIVAKITPCFENGKGAYLGALPTEHGFGSTEFMVLRARDRVLPAYLYFQTTLPHFRELGARNMTGAAGQQRVTDEFIKQFVFALTYNVTAGG